MTANDPPPCVAGLQEVSCCSNLLQSTLNAAFSNDTGCASLDDLNITLEFNPVTGLWENKDGQAVSHCGTDWDLEMECGPLMTDCTGFSLRIAGNACLVGGADEAVASCTCNPLNLVFGPITAGGIDCSCCSEGGTFQVTVTE